MIEDLIPTAASRLHGRSRTAAALANDRHGVAGVEFALLVTFLAVAMVNAVDAARFYYQRMEVENATQMAAQAAWKTCDVKSLPATTKCAGLDAAVERALASASLANGVKLKARSPSEGYYCLNSSAVLQYMGDVSEKPANCGAVGKPGIQAADYLKIETTYTYQPIFPGVGIGGMLPNPITSSSLVRLQ